MFVLKHLKTHYWPTIASGWIVLTCVTSYFIAVSNGHVYYLFPYISDTGAAQPESCIFGIMMNIAALLLAVTLYIRYRQVEFALNSEDVDFSRKWNKVSLYSGFTVCVGTSIVGNFQESPILWILFVHISGAFMVFGNGILFLFLQTTISFALRPVYRKYPEFGVGSYNLYFRIFLTACLPILLTVIGLCSLIAFIQHTGTSYIYWSNKQGGYEFRLGATFAELFLIADLVIYLIFTTNEFKAVEYGEIGFKSKYISNKNYINETA